MKTHRIGPRIQVSQHAQRWIATVGSDIPSWQRQALEGWFGAWLALGAMFGYGAYSSAGSERSFYLICLGFWAFFAVRAFRAVRWRRSGMEVVQLSPEGLEVRMDHGQRPGKPTAIPLAQVTRAEVAAPNPRSFLESMDQQFWVVGGDRLSVGKGRRPVVFGKQLSHSEAAQLAESFNAALKKLQRNAQD